MLLARLALTLLALSAAQSLDPANLKNITIYHVNEAKFGPIPINMDTGDAIGDLFFDMLEVISQPLRCDGPNRPLPNPDGPDFCKNQEAAGPNLRVNKLTLEVDSRFSAYAACNVGVNNTTPFGGYCKTDTYCCGCVKHGGPHGFEPVPCNKTMGYERVYETMGRFIQGCKSNASTVDCYTDNVFKKLSSTTPGIWYSSLEKAFCGSSAVGTGGCTWRVASVDKIVKRACHTQVFGAAVSATAPACFDRCGDQKTNVTSPCWSDCFYKAALGPDSGQPGGVVAGMSTMALEQSWVKPFLSEEDGGCPALCGVDDECRGHGDETAYCKSNGWCRCDTQSGFSGQFCVK